MGVVQKVDLPHKEQLNRLLFTAVGAFLADHRLDPTPSNYMLAYALVTRSNEAAVAAIEAATGDGFRLTQRDADRIMEESGIGKGAAIHRPDAESNALAEACKQLELVEGIVGKTQAHAQSYGRALESSAARLSAFAGGDPIEDLLRITGEMVERTKAAEKQLQQTNEEVQSLRRELASVSEEARTDPLTGLPNRRALEDCYARLQREGGVFTAAVCDIDSFKAVNDTHGHAIGDRVLKAVAGVLQTSCHGHVVSRFGGEEFVVLFGGTSAKQAMELIEGARAELAARTFRVRETDKPLGQVTLSAGVAQARPGEGWTELLQRADGLLYEAKAAGRNRVHVAEEPKEGL
jgi:diguanylate cyclase